MFQFYSYVYLSYVVLLMMCRSLNSKCHVCPPRRPVQSHRWSARSRPRAPPAWNKQRARSLPLDSACLLSRVRASASLLRATPRHCSARRRPTAPEWARPCRGSSARCSRQPPPSGSRFLLPAARNPVASRTNATCSTTRTRCCYSIDPRQKHNLY